MRTSAIAIAGLLAFSALVSARPAAAQKKLNVQPACASVEPGKGEGKFTGQVYSAQPGSFQVASGKEMAAVSYNNSLLVCESGQISSPESLIPGATVEVIGSMAKKGNNYQFAATKVLVTAAAPNAPRAASSDSMLQNNVTGSSARGTAQGGGNAGSPSPQAGVIGSSARGGAVTSSDTVACNSLQFEVTGASTATGSGAQKTTTTPFTCRRNIDQESMAFLQDAMSGRRLANITLSWQGSLVVTMVNAEVSTVTFTPDNTGQIVEIGFTAEKWEINHLSSGSKVASDSWNAR